MYTTDPCVHKDVSHLPGIFFPGARPSSSLMRTTPLSRSTCRSSTDSPVSLRWSFTQFVNVFFCTSIQLRSARSGTGSCGLSAIAAYSPAALAVMSDQHSRFSTGRQSHGRNR